MPSGRSPAWPQFVLSSKGDSDANGDFDIPETNDIDQDEAIKDIDIPDVRD